MQIGGRRCHVFSRGNGGPVIYWGMSGDGAEGAVRLLDGMTGGCPWRIVAYDAGDWNRDFSPWPAPAAFGQSDFSGGGRDTLKWLLEECIPEIESEAPPAVRMIGGYSLAGLFSLWAFYESGVFYGAASCSGSLWYPGWREYVQDRPAPTDSIVYLSLGEREERTRNRAMAVVGDATRRQIELLRADVGVRECTLEWHPGGHFADVDARMAQGFAWLLRHAQ